MTYWRAVLVLLVAGGTTLRAMRIANRHSTSDAATCAPTLPVSVRRQTWWLRRAVTDPAVRLVHKRTRTAGIGQRALRAVQGLLGAGRPRLVSDGLQGATKGNDPTRTKYEPPIGRDATKLARSGGLFLSRQLNVLFTTRKTIRIRTSLGRLLGLLGAAAQMLNTTPTNCSMPMTPFSG